MKKYRLKTEVKKYVSHELAFSLVEPMEYWERSIWNKEALEEVPQRVELMFNISDKGVDFGMENKRLLIKTDRTLFTDKEKALCEKALNGELLDIDSLDERDFYKWYINKTEKSILTNIKAVLKQYLEQRGN